MKMQLYEIYKKKNINRLNVFYEMNASKWQVVIKISNLGVFLS